MKSVHGKRFYKVALFVLLPLYLIATILVSIVAPISVMAFDSPGSEERWVPWVFMLSFFGMALSFFIADILIILFALKNKRRSLIISLLLPFPFILTIILIFIFQPTF